MLFRLIAMGLMWGGLALPSPCSATNLALRSFAPPGAVSFEKTTNAAYYRMEWAATATSSWQSLFQLAPLDRIPQSGQSNLVVEVPAFYRVAGYSVPSNMVLIPGGTFLMGHPTNQFSLNDGDMFDEAPQHPVTLRPFLMERTEVSGMLWSRVYEWAITNTYIFDLMSSDWKSNSHPAVFMNWYEAVKWCNARSEMEGLTPVYYTDSAQTSVYRTLMRDLDEGSVRWTANGYRLPTEAEWEFAALGGIPYLRFPWADYTNNISHAKANYQGGSSLYGYAFDLSDGYHPDYDDLFFGFPYTAPVTTLSTNGYGLYHMAGNVSEWCWDWYAHDYYSSSPASNPRGASAITYERVIRGGNWKEPGFEARNANRKNLFPGSISETIGFRCVIGF